MVSARLVVPAGRRTKRDRIAGGVVGLLLGDACGLPVEFSTRGERDRDPVRGLRGWGTHHQPYGAWSDDGALALAHVAACLRAGWDPAAHLDEFRAWFERGAHSATGSAFDIGATTARAIRRWSQGCTWDAAGCAGERDNGNGSLMRILPMSCWCAAWPAMARVRILGEASALTHAHPRARLACALHGEVAVGLIDRLSLPEALAAATRRLRSLVPDSERLHFTPLLDASCLDWPRARVPSDGYVLSTLCAACWCLAQSEDFAEAVLLAVNLGGDTDTTAAVVGGLAGLRCGLSGLPAPWTACLKRRVEVLNLAEDFAVACLNAHGNGGLRDAVRSLRPCTAG